MPPPKRVPQTDAIFEELKRVNPQADRVEEMRSALIEGVIQESEDETLMDRYLAGEDNTFGLEGQLISHQGRVLLTVAGGAVAYRERTIMLSAA